MRVEVAQWYVHLDPVGRNSEQEVRLMAHRTANTSSGIAGFFQFARSSQEPSFRPIILPYDLVDRLRDPSVPGMDRNALFGDAAGYLFWNEIPDISPNTTETIEITVAENYLPDDNGIRFIGVGSPRVTTDRAHVLIMCDVPSLTVTYSGGTETLAAHNGVIFAMLRFTVDEHLADTIVINGKEYPKIFFGEYQRNFAVVIDEQFGQPRFSERSFRDYQVVLAESER
jgi:hypothetical protein